MRVPEDEHLHLSLPYCHAHDPFRIPGAYAKLKGRIHGLKLAEVEINRKMLSEMAVNDAEGFKSVAELAKSRLA